MFMFKQDGCEQQLPEEIDMPRKFRNHSPPPLPPGLTSVLQAKETDSSDMRWTLMEFAGVEQLSVPYVLFRLCQFFALNGSDFSFVALHYTGLNVDRF